MSTRGNVASALASAGVLAIGWQLGLHPAVAAVPAPGGSNSGSVGTSTTGSGTRTSGSAGTGTAGSGTSGTTGRPGASATSGNTGTGTQQQPGGFQGGPGGRGGGQSVSVGLKVPAGASGTFTGQTAQNRWGSVRVTVTLASGRITNLTEAVDDLGNDHSARINNQAVPVLKRAILAAASGGNVSTVSGATYTTQSYLTSLQSALDQAG